MKKYIRKHIKDEKRILKLMYKKGIIDKLVSDFKYCGWETVYKGKKGRNRKGKGFSFTDWIPEFHLYNIDYWGEVESHSLVGHCREDIMMKNAEYCEIEGWSNLNTSVKDTKGLIDYLTKLPTIRNDSKFNKYLKLSCV